MGLRHAGGLLHRIVSVLKCHEVDGIVISGVHLFWIREAVYQDSSKDASCNSKFLTDCFAGV